MDPAAHRPAPPARLWLAAALAVAVLVASGLYARKVVQTVERSGQSGTTRSALLRWAPQIDALWRGEDAYARFNYPNPPVMAVLLTPFTSLPPWAAALAWFYFKVGLAVFAVLWAFRLAEAGGPPWPLWAKVAVVLLSLRPLVGDLSHGNVNILILFLVVAALYAFRRGLDFTAGLTLGLAVACKVTPALFLPYFVYKRAWRLLAGCAAGLVLFLAVVPGVAFGHARNLELLGGWYTVMVKPFVLDGQVTPEHQNQSLPGLAHRLLTRSPAFSTYVEDEATGVDVYTPVSYMTVVDLGPAAARWLVKLLLVAFALAVVWSCRTPAHAPAWDRADPRGTWRLAAEYSLVLCGMLLFSERTWKHHAVTLVLPFAVLVYALAVLPLARWVRAGVAATLALVVALTWGTSEGVLGKDGADYAMGYGCHTAAWAAVAAACVLLLKAGPAAAAAGYELTGGRVLRKGGVT